MREVMDLADVICGKRPGQREIFLQPVSDSQGYITLVGVRPSPVDTLTRICLARHIIEMESVFDIIAEPNRRAILSFLVSSEQSVGEIERQLRMPQPTVSKHLRVLREAGFVESTVDAQRRLYRLKPEAFQELDAWLAPFRRFWSAHVDALERHLDCMGQSTRTKRKTRRKR
jgi:DNA-binding transcriptional ArsR family regulator